MNLPFSRPEPNDEELARRVANGDQAALSLLYDRYAPAVWAMVVHTLGRNDAEDIVQEVFLRLWNRADRFDPARGEFVAWFMTIARYRVLNELRHRSVAARVTVSDDIEAVLLNAPDPAADIESVAQGNEEGADLAAAIALLPADQRRAILLSYFGGLSHSDIAGALDWPLGTVKKRIRLGLDKLRAAFGVKQPAEPPIRGLSV